MANILGQSDIDKTFASASARTKLINSYVEICCEPCIYDLFIRSELILCLQDIVKSTPKTKEQNAVIQQCRYILGRINHGKH